MIIEICPICGSDLEHTVLTSNPPQRKVKCSRCGWQHVETEKTIRIPYVVGDQNKQSPCDTCTNNTANGGSGICHCILGQPIIM